MNAEQIAFALSMTGIVFAVTTCGWGAWVADESRGYDYKKWHRPLVAIFAALAGASFIAAAWFGATTL